MIHEKWMWNGSFWKYNALIVSFFQRICIDEKKLKYNAKNGWF